MDLIDANKINSFLYDFSNGFLMKYRYGKGIDMKLLNKFYEILEQLRIKWRGEKLIEKEIIYELICIVPGMYYDLSIYSENEDFEEYKSILYKLEVAISSCLNPNYDDPSFNLPLRELGNI